MSAKTKIVVLHMKELIYTAIFAVLGILFIVLLAMMFLPGKDKERDREPDMADTSGSEPVMAEISSLYIPGIYTTQLLLGSESLDVEVIVDKDSITSAAAHAGFHLRAGLCAAVPGIRHLYCREQVHLPGAAGGHPGFPG